MSELRLVFFVQLVKTSLVPADVSCRQLVLTVLSEFRPVVFDWFVVVKSIPVSLDGHQDISERFAGAKKEQWGVSPEFATRG